MLSQQFTRSANTMRQWGKGGGVRRISSSPLPSQKRKGHAAKKASGE